MNERQVVISAGYAFPCMGDHIAENGVRALEWIEAEPKEIEEFKKLDEQLVRDEYNELVDDEFATPRSRANDELLERMAQIINNALSYIELGCWPPHYRMQPAQLCGGGPIYADESEYRLDINDHGNVVCYNNKNQELWSIV